MATVPGFQLVVDGNRVSFGKTLLKNAATHIATAGTHLFSALGIREPDVVVDDFCAWTARYAHVMRKPLVAVDNIHFITRCTHPKEWIDAHPSDAAAAMVVTLAAVPEARFYFVLSFTRAAPVSQPLTALQLPIVRQQVLEARHHREEGPHLVAYFNDRADWPGILASLLRTGRPVRAYGCPGIGHEQQVGSVTLCPFGKKLIADLATCHAAIGGAGFSFLSEALALGKPLLAVPFDGSFEQILNARYLDREGFGTWAPSLTDAALGGFLERVGTMRERASAFPCDENRGIFENLDRLLGSL